MLLNILVRKKIVIVEIERIKLSIQREKATFYNKFKSNYRLNQIQQIKSMVDKEKNKTIYL